MRERAVAQHAVGVQQHGDVMAREREAGGVRGPEARVVGQLEHLGAPVRGQRDAAVARPGVDDDQLRADLEPASSERSSSRSSAAESCSTTTTVKGTAAP